MYGDDPTDHVYVAPSPFAFTYDEDGTLSAQSAIFQALGAASMAWTETPSGVFESEWAKEIGDALLDFLHLDQPHLGYATTRQLLEEITARIDTDHASGGGGLDYRTVGTL